MAIPSSDYPALKVELDTDPQGLGLTAMGDGEAATKLNEVGASGETVDVDVADVADVMAGTVASEYQGLQPWERQLWDSVIATGAGPMGGIPVKKQGMRDIVVALWDAGTATRVNMVALQVRPASRGEVLFGEGSVVDSRDVAEARALP